MDNFGDFIERVRDANPIEDVIQEDGFSLRGGRIMKGTGKDHDSLNVRVDWQRAWWYSKNWQGDVFAWVQLQKGCEFWEAVEYLASTGDSVESIAAALGYQDAANFRRAFRGWENCSPGEYRDRASSGA